MSADQYPDQYRPVGEILSLVGEKWTVVVVAHLGNGKMRFNELKREITGISQKMLAGTLRGLERDGFVSRTIFPVIPPRVEYELTDLGIRLFEPIRALGKFAMDHRIHIEAARLRFDEGMIVEIIEAVPSRAIPKPAADASDTERD